MKTLITILLSLSLQAAIAQNSEAVKNAFSKSYTLEYNKQYQKAADEFTAIYDAKSYEMNLRLGWLLYEVGKYNDAVDYYQKAIALHAYSVEAKLGMVYPLSAQNKWDEVLNQYRLILAIDVKNTLVNYRTGLIYYNRKNYAAAQKYFDTVLQIYPFDYDCLLMSAWNNYAQGDKAEAKNLFEKALMNTPSSKSAQEGLALCNK
ncbi:MAG: tetratricopeptide repeat protein [Bacteroidetes bacterium]|nr:tetratricopeptide repeat protein [Bacteroidota bacterium]